MGFVLLKILVASFLVISPCFGQEYDFGAEISRQCLVPDPVGLLDCVENKVTLPYLTSWVDCTNSLGQNVQNSADIINYRCKSVWEGKGVIPEVFYIKDCVIEKTGLPAKNVSAEVLGAYKECEGTPAAQKQQSSVKSAPLQQKQLYQSVAVEYSTKGQISTPSFQTTIPVAQKIPQAPKPVPTVQYGSQTSVPTTQYRPQTQIGVPIVQYGPQIQTGVPTVQYGPQIQTGVPTVQYGPQIQTGFPTVQYGSQIQTSNPTVQYGQRIQTTQYGMPVQTNNPGIQYNQAGFNTAPQYNRQFQTSVPMANSFAQQYLQQRQPYSYQYFIIYPQAPLQNSQTYQSGSMPSQGSKSNPAHFSQKQAFPVQQQISM